MKKILVKNIINKSSKKQVFFLGICASLIILLAGCGIRNNELAVPTMTVETPNFGLGNGTDFGDIVAKAEGFTLVNSTIKSKGTFGTQE